ncbi:MAG: heme o synthase [Thermoanaerobaculia bacterium]|nr:heme o synthase [Thermoanaerobaculia bacterium]
MSSEALAFPRPADWVELTKPRITLLVTLTTAAGFALASERPLDLPKFAATLVGTALVAAGSSAWNQYVERETDQLMRRTASRPLPGGRMIAEHALAFGGLLSVSGLLVLWLLVNPLTAAIGLATLFAYVAVYTPMKRRSSLATLIGAIPGAAPPVMGWTGASGALDLGGWLLFAILFLWQLPHFLSIAWLYRDDYRRAGMPLLTVNDPDGRRTGRQAVLYALTLVPVSILPSAVGITGAVHLAGALLFGLAFLASAVLFAREQSVPTARRLLLTSVCYLPAVFSVAVFDHLFLR